MKVIIVGGGWSGCSAASMAAALGMEVLLIEKTDMLLGTGLVGGIMRNNGRYTATEEMIALGGGDLFQIIDDHCKHKNVDFPGHRHASLYNVHEMPHAIESHLKKLGVHILYNTRIVQVTKNENSIVSVTSHSKKEYYGDLFLDATGTAGPMGNCAKYGNGCATCIMRCPSFGGRVSLTALAGVEELIGRRMDGRIGSMNGSCKLLKESLSPSIRSKLSRDGVVMIPLPPDLQEDHLSKKSCQQYAHSFFTENLILLDTGHAKLMTPFFPLEKLHKIPGMEKACYKDPYAGGIGNSIRFTSCAPCDITFQVKGINNLYCCGEKAGLYVGHTEAIITGILSVVNGIRFLQKEPPFILPRQLFVGEGLSFAHDQMQTEEGLKYKYTFSGSILFEHLIDEGLYTTNVDKIRARVDELGLTNVLK